MKINFEQNLCNFKGVPLKSDNEEITLKWAAVGSLLAQYNDEPSLAPAEKYSRYELAKRIYGGVQEFSLEDVAKIKALIGKNFVPMIVGPAYDMLEGKNAPAVEVEAKSDES